MKPGINVIYGENEAGKSTIHTFIKGMLFGIERLRGRGSLTKENHYVRYLPWEYPGAFGGSMEIVQGDKEYRLLRSFHANDKSFVVTDLNTGREIKLAEGLISELIPGLTESTYRNTVSIEQLKASTDGELSSQVRNYITNLSISRSKEVDVPKAVKSLNDQRRQLEMSINSLNLKDVLSEIEDGLMKEERMDKLTKELRGLLQEKKELEHQILQEQSHVNEAEAAYMEQLPAILEKYKSYLDLTRQGRQLETEEKELNDTIRVHEWELREYENLMEDRIKFRELEKELKEVQLREDELDENMEDTSHVGGRSRKIILLPVILLSALIVALEGGKPLGLAIGIMVLIFGAIAYKLMGRTNNSEDSEEELEEMIEQKELILKEIRQIMQEYGVNSGQELVDKQEELLHLEYSLEHDRSRLIELEHRINDLEDSRDTLYDVIMKYLHHFISEDDLTSSSIQRLQEVIFEKKKQGSENNRKLNLQREENRIAIEKIRWEIGTLEGNEERLLENKVRYQEMEHKQQENMAELEAIKLALRTIEELSVDIHDSFGNQINKAVSDVISEVTGEKYTDVKVDEKLEIKVGWNQNYIPLDRLSAGTIDQVYFALRLAVSELLLNGEEMTVLLDDSFALYDDNRVKAAINKLRKKKQVILFTCHNREQRLLKEMGVPFHFVNL